MDIVISHETTYRYDRPVNYSIQTLRLTPCISSGQSVLRWNIVGGGRSPASSGEDGFGNLVHTLTTVGDHSHVTIRASGEVRTQDTNGVLSGAIERFRPLFYLRPTGLTEADEAIHGLARQAKRGADGDLDLGHRLMGLVRDAVDYETGATDAAHTAAEAIAAGAGVCQDHAHVFIACARALEVPARYVSGYLWSEGCAGPFDAGHAWAELFVDDLGWVGFDVANRICPTDAHVRVAVGRDYLDAAPVRGLRSGSADEQMRVQVQVSAAQ